MCQLRCHIHAALAPGRQRPLLVQRLRPLLQNERTKQTPHQTKEKTGKCFNCDALTSVAGALSGGLEVRLTK